MSFLVQALVFFVAALIVVPLCKRLGLSSVLGYLGAGLLIGPNSLALIGDAQGVLHFAEIGVVLLLFVIGLELKPRRLWVMRKAVFGLGSLQLSATSVAIAASAHFVLGLEWIASAVIGFALALSSTAFVLQLLGERRELATPHGRAAFGVLLLQDVAVIPVIAILTAMAPNADGHAATPEPLMVLVLIAGFVAARFSLRPVLRVIASTGIQELFLAAGLALVVGSATAMQAAGLSMGLGAFIAGMMVADSEYRHQLETDIMPFKGLLLGLFFMAVGMSADVGLLAHSPVTIVALALALVVVKCVVLLPFARAHVMSFSEALRTSVVLSQGGEFAFVLLTVAASAVLISADELAIALLVVTLSMATTPFASSLVERFLKPAGDDRPYDEIDEPENPVVIAGFGRFGQIVGRVLSMRGIAFTALEASAVQVDFVRKFGAMIYYGDVTRLDLLRAAKVNEARAFVLAVDDVETSLKVARLVRENFPNVTILARARNRHHELQLRELGVPVVMRETLGSSLELTRDVLTRMGYSAGEALSAISTFREHDSRLLERQAAVFHDEKAFRQTTRDAVEELKTLFAEDNS